MEKADINKDGKLTFDEFTAYMNDPELEWKHFIYIRMKTKF